MIVRVATLEEEDVAIVSLLALVTALGSWAEVSPMARRVWSASSAIT
jgi:hypothetical protein